jgi:hypothetical protein
VDQYIQSVRAFREQLEERTALLRKQQTAAVIMIQVNADLRKEVLALVEALREGHNLALVCLQEASGGR